MIPAQTLYNTTSYGHLYGLLQRLAGQVHGVAVASGSDTALPSPPPHSPAPTATRLDLSWYLQLVRNRCQRGEGGGLECGQLLSHLEYSEIINIMSGKSFNTALLTHTLRLGLTSTLQANRDWGECNSSVETGDSEECSSGSGTSEAPLYTASKVILLQHLARVAASLPRPHHTFTPGFSLVWFPDSGFPGRWFPAGNECCYAKAGLGLTSWCHWS
ncbi:Huntingtin [Portunus trituberculatus]|uniref:Huntingtin n=1 Tax=Portunus trituberculatus TaxID=210409 RepID=A0A5B7DD07_PORTR|nr:Huntingtin [Portunus trituberculatus]